MTGAAFAQSPEDLPRLFAERWNEGDAAGLAVLFAEDADFVNVVGLWWRKRRDIERAHAYAFARYFRDAKLALEEVKVRFLGDAVAAVHAKWLMTGQINPGRAEGAPRGGVVLFVAEKTGEGWRAVACQNTDIAPGAETNMVENGKLKPVSY